MSADAGSSRDDEERAPILVLGVGNELFTDEGLGCVAATRIAALNLPGVDVRDGSTLGIALLPELAGRQALLLLDAIVGGDAEPGDLVVLRGAEVPAHRQLTVSAHQIGVGEALAAAELAGCVPPRLAAVGMVPECLDTGYGLSAGVERRMDALIEQALGVLAEWGVLTTGAAMPG